MKEVSEHKVNMLLVNKADLLTREQRRAWAKHFEKEGLRAVFWSALAESDRLDAEEKVRRFEETYSVHHHGEVDVFTSYCFEEMLVHNLNAHFCHVSSHRAWKWMIQSL